MEKAGKSNPHDYRGILPELLSKLGVHPWDIDAAVASAYYQEQRQLGLQEWPRKTTRIEIPIRGGLALKFVTEHFAGKIKTLDIILVEGRDIKYQYLGSQYHPKHAEQRF